MICFCFKIYEFSRQNNQHFDPHILLFLAQKFKLFLKSKLLCLQCCKRDFKKVKQTSRYSLTVPVTQFKHIRHVHGVWKSQKKCHSTLRAKRATFTFWVDKSWLKKPKNGQFWRVFRKPEAYGQTVLPDRQINFNWQKIVGKGKN